MLAFWMIIIIGLQMARNPSSYRRNVKMEKNPRWNGGITVKDGYVYRKVKWHPSADSHGYYAEHRLVVEGLIGRKLLPREHVHHLNHVKDDNRPSNLELMDISEHRSKHTVGDSNPRYNKNVDDNIVLKLSSEGHGPVAISKITGWPQSTISRRLKNAMAKAAKT